MKVLWFELAIPSRYNNKGLTIYGGWQDSLENIVRNYLDIELIIAFKGKGVVKQIDNVTYVPIDINFNSYEKIKNLFTWNCETQKLIKEAINIVNIYNPDVIQVFGSEWPFGLISKYTDIPVVIHMQGSAGPYQNAKYPPSYNYFTYIFAMKGNIVRYIWYTIQTIKQKSRVKMEKEIYNSVKFYMGRTCWDKAVTYVYNNKRTYYHVDEAIREIFYDNKQRWVFSSNTKKLKLITVGCSTLYKGIDLMLKTAAILKENNMEFEWNVIGNMPNEFRILAEYKENKKFKDLNINLLGVKQAVELKETLLSSTMYIHTSYIDNSPNAICEAQLLGLPIISTNVGGISSLITDNIDGILVPANDPYRMAYNIIKLSKNVDLLIKFSKNSITRALERHSQSKIANDLYNCYCDISNI